MTLLNTLQSLDYHEGNVCYLHPVREVVRVKEENLNSAICAFARDFREMPTMYDYEAAKYFSKKLTAIISQMRWTNDELFEEEPEFSTFSQVVKNFAKRLGMGYICEKKTRQLDKLNFALESLHEGLERIEPHGWSKDTLPNEKKSKLSICYRLQGQKGMELEDSSSYYLWNGKEWALLERDGLVIEQALRKHGALCSGIEARAFRAASKDIFSEVVLALIPQNRMLSQIYYNVYFALKDGSPMVYVEGSAQICEESQENGDPCKVFALYQPLENDEYIQIRLV